MRMLLLLVGLGVFGVEYPESDFRAYKYYQNEGRNIIKRLAILNNEIEKLEREIEKIEYKIDDIYNRARDTKSDRTRKSLYAKKDKYRSDIRYLETKLSKLQSEERGLTSKLKDVKNKYLKHKEKVQKYYNELSKSKKRNEV